MNETNNYCPENQNSPAYKLEQTVNSMKLENSRDALTILDTISNFSLNAEENLADDIEAGGKKSYGCTYKSEITKYISLLSKSIIRIKQKENDNLNNHPEVDQRITKIADANLTALTNLIINVERFISQGQMEKRTGEKIKLKIDNRGINLFYDYLVMVRDELMNSTNTYYRSM